MKKIFTLFAALTMVMSMSALTYNVEVPAGTKVCYIAGAMNGWSHTEMTKVDETHYTLEVATATNEMEYKYCSGPDWKYVEKKADGSDIDNRKYSESDVVAKWGAVYNPEVVVEKKDMVYNVTVPAGTNACYIAGDMTSWGHREMTKVDDTHYTITLTAAPDDAYKYCSGPDWKYVELKADGGEVQNRSYAENDEVAKWKEVYGSSDPSAVTYVLMGVGGDWTTGIAMTVNPANDQEYMLIGQVISEGDAVKVVTLTNGTATAWCGNVEDGSVAVEYDKDGNLVLTPGKYDFYYKVDVDKVYIGVSSTTAVDNVTVEEVKAVKVIRNGQMYILRDGVLYNAIGQIAE